MLGIIDDKPLMVINKHVKNISQVTNNLRVGILQLLSLKRQNKQAADKNDRGNNTGYGTEIISRDKIEPFQKNGFNSRIRHNPLYY